LDKKIWLLKGGNREFPWEMLSIEILTNVILSEVDDLHELIESMVKMSLVNRSFRSSISLYMKDFKFCSRIFAKYLRKYKSVPDSVYNFGTMRNSKNDCYIGSEWVNNGVLRTDISDKEGFVKMARKCLILQYSPFCSMCHRNFRGSRYPPGVLEPFWMLGVKICKICRKDCFVSSRKMYSMGLRLDVELSTQSKCNKYLVEELLGKVFCLRFVKKTNGLKLLTSDDDDVNIRLNFSSSGYLLFWKHHLKNVIDFEAVKTEYEEKQRSGKIIFAYVKRLKVQMHVCNCRGFRDWNSSMVTINFSSMTDENKELFIIKAENCGLYRKSQIDKRRKVDMGSMLASKKQRWNRKISELMTKYNNVGFPLCPGPHAMTRIQKEVMASLTAYETLFNEAKFEKAYETELEKRVLLYQKTSFAIC